MRRSDPIHKTCPRIINDSDTNQYVIGKCRCPKDIRYVLAVDINNLTLDEKISGKCHMYCPMCGTDIIVGFMYKEI